MVKTIYSITLFAIAAFVSIASVSCSNRKKDNAGQKKQTFPVIHPLVKDTLFATEYVAEIQSIQHVELRARVRGLIERIHVDEGQFVRKGQSLFTLGAQEYRDDLIKARALLKSAIADSKSAEVEARNVQKLVDKQIVSKSEMEIAESRLAAAKARIEEAAAQEATAVLKLSFTDIKAPFDGIIDRIPKKIGSLVEEAELLTTISDNSQVFAYFNVSEREYLDYVTSDEKATQSEALLMLANNQLHAHKGIVETVEGKIDRSTGNIAFRARFSNSEGLLKHGSSGKVRLQRLIKGAVLVPQKSTFDVQDKTYVYVVDANNQTALRAIVPKYRLSHFYIVDSGVSATDKIVYEGIQQIKEGDVIQTQLRPSAEALAQLNLENQ